MLPQRQKITLSPIKPYHEAVPARNPSTSSPTQKKSPSLRQSMSFLKNSISSSPNSSSDFQDQSSNMSSSSSTRIKGGLEKYHSMSNKQPITLSGRIIPQKSDINIKKSSDLQGAPLSAKSRSITSLSRRVASSSSLRSAAYPERIASSSSISSKSYPPMTRTYPAVLSKVSMDFRERIQLGSRFKNGLEYRDSFTGAEAVDLICRIIRTSDRNLALLMGRSLDAQKFFHDVTYEHRLRDSSNEVYQFAEEVFSPYYNSNPSLQISTRHASVVSENTLNEDGVSSPTMEFSPTMNTQISGSFGYSTNESSTTLNGGTLLTHSNSIMNANNNNNNTGNTLQVTGVFTLLTSCYSPTCTRDSLCYSIACPRRLEQQERLSLKAQGGLARSDSRISLNDQEDQKAFWSLTVPKSLLENMDKGEIKRQECIFETIYSERDFVKDLEYLREFWIKPLSETKIIKEQEREHFVNTVFFNITEIWEVNNKFAEALTRRQQKESVVKEVGDIFVEWIPRMEPFIKYGAGQVMGKYEFDRQKRHNPLFVKFIEDRSNRVESRRLDVSSYLSKSTTRPARYPLLLKSILAHTDPESKEYANLQKAIEMLQIMLKRINYETGKAADRLNLFLLKQKLVFRPGELVDLKLTSENRRLLYQCVLKKRNYQDKEKQGEVQCYLFDHALLFVRIKIINKREVYRVYQRPIPLPLLYVSLGEEAPSVKQLKKNASTSSLSGSSSSIIMNPSNVNLNNLSLASTVAKCPISFLYYGPNGYDLVLYAKPAVQRMLIEKLEQQTKSILEDNDVFTLTPLSSRFFDYSNKINCVIPFDGGRRLLYGTDSGIYTADVKVSEKGRVVSTPTKIIAKINIMQLEILEEYQILLALSDKKLIYWPLEVLSSHSDASKNSKLGKELMTHVSFFKIGVCGGRMLVCAAKSSNHIIRIYEPIDPIQQKKTKKKFKMETKDINFASEPVSISFLKTKLCVGCSKGFEIVSLETNAMEQLLDPADTSLDFAIGKEGLKPLEIDRINSDFLLSYSSFSFFINHNGWRSRPKWIIHWEGVPHAFALWYPYLLAFDSSFIEIRHVESGELLRVIIAENIRFLHASSQEILYAYEDESGYDVVASLDFWDKTKKNRSRSATITEIE
ncbi:unnamed protein product [[Candida] boidinii]|uniref:Unnamed protein product n=1 Tax=Candida boidinii TaxID=5477 RepID=A0A9W6T078_CANBO|nr:unnamed protein product [[Candida] boidinii]